MAVLYNADVIVFEHLDLKGRKRGSKKQRLHLWKAQRVQSIVTDQAHRLGMRVNHVNAWNTSRLAFDAAGASSGAGSLKRQMVLQRMRVPEREGL